MSSLPVLHYPWPFDSSSGHGSFVVIVAFASDGRVAFVRSAEKERDWELPGGRIHSGEGACAAAVREMKEETGWELENEQEVAIIYNTAGNEVHSRVKVVAGRIPAVPAVGSPDQEILECTLRYSTPQPSTFKRSWVEQVIGLAAKQISVHENKLLWNCIAREYESSTYISDTVVHYGPLIAGENQMKLLPDLTGSRVLDLGCGGGQNLSALWHYGAAEGVGVDFSREQVSIARERLRNTDFEVVEADMSEYPIKGRFDLILSIFSLAFVANPEPLFQRIAKSLSPGGVFILSIDNPDRAGKDFTGQKSDWNVSHSSRRLWSTEHSAPIVYSHHLHSRSTLFGAFEAARLKVEAILEPRALPKSEIMSAPYRSDYYLERYEELRTSVYSMIIKARRM